MRNCLSISIILIVFLVLTGCNHNSVDKIKVDSFDISLGQSLYSGDKKVENETVQSLVDAYNSIEYIGQTNEQINFRKAITITFVLNDQISGTLVIDDKWIFHLNDSVGNYQIDPNNEIYELAMQVYNDLKQEYSNF
ncbi:hypothetical protein ACH0B5_03935 [Ureibacillus sp. 179-F W5.1 NHS]|uniref:hypothetical protein n=1 Tax=Ureibacillus sp. 179-F W5.1 NHS TaxID=3374297 RepID=UPI0038795450